MSEGQPLGNPTTRSDSKCPKCEDVMKRLKIAQEVIKSSFNIFLNSVGTSKVHDQNEEEVKVSIYY